MPVLLAHIAGIPVEETVAMVAPVLGATCVALMATLRGNGRWSWRRRRAAEPALRDKPTL